MTLNLTRGDRHTLTVANLLDETGAPAVLSVSDVLHWTAKVRHGDTDVQALLTKKSPSNGITFTPGSSTATITISPADWAAISFPVDQRFVWDLQIELGGDPTQVVTAAQGDGLIAADVTLTVP